MADPMPKTAYELAAWARPFMDAGASAEDITYATENMTPVSQGLDCCRDRKWFRQQLLAQIELTTERERILYQHQKSQNCTKGFLMARKNTDRSVAVLFDSLREAVDYCIEYADWRLSQDLKNE